MSEIEVILFATAGSFIGYILGYILGNIIGNMLIDWVYGKDDNDD